MQRIKSLCDNSLTEAARALRAIYLNIVGDTKTEIEEGVTWTTGEIEGLRDVIKLYAKDAWDAAQASGGIIDPMEAIAGLAKSVKDGVLSEAQLMEMVSDIGGKLRTSQLLALINNWDMYETMLAQYRDAFGSADKEVENAMDSWTRKTNVLKNTWTEFVQKSLSTNLFKGFIDSLTWIIKHLGSLASVLRIIAGFYLAAKISQISNSIKVFMTVFKSTEGGIKNFVNTLKATRIASREAKAEGKELTAEMVKEKVAADSATASISALSIAISVLTITYTVATVAVNSYENALEKKRETAKKAQEETEAEVKTIRDRIAANKELENEYYAIINGSDDEAKKNEELISLKEKLIDLYGDEKNAIDDVVDSKEDYVAITEEEIRQARINDLEEALRLGAASYEAAKNTLAYSNPSAGRTALSDDYYGTLFSTITSDPYYAEWLKSDAAKSVGLGNASVGFAKGGVYSFWFDEYAQYSGKDKYGNIQPVDSQGAYYYREQYGNVIDKLHEYLQNNDDAGARYYLNLLTTLYTALDEDIKKAEEVRDEYEKNEKELEALKNGDYEWEEPETPKAGQSAQSGIGAILANTKALDENASAADRLEAAKKDAAAASQRFYENAFDENGALTENAAATIKANKSLGEFVKTQKETKIEALKQQIAALTYSLDGLDETSRLIAVQTIAGLTKELEKEEAGLKSVTAALEENITAQDKLNVAKERAKAAAQALVPVLFDESGRLTEVAQEALRSSSYLADLVQAEIDLQNQTNQANYARMRAELAALAGEAVRTAKAIMAAYAMSASMMTLKQYALENGATPDVMKALTLLNAMEAMEAKINTLSGYSSTLAPYTSSYKPSSSGSGSSSSKPSSSSSSSTTKTEDEKLKALQNRLTLLKSELSLMQERGDSEADQIKKMKEIMKALHNEAEYLRSIGGDQATINNLSQEWWSYHNKIESIMDKEAEDAERQAKAIQDAVNAQIALNNALKQRNVRIYNAATGRWEWTANPNDVNSARETYNNAMANLSPSDMDAYYAALEKAYAPTTGFRGSELFVQWLKGNGNSGGSTHNGNNYNFGNFTFTEAQAKGISLYDLAQLSRSLSIYS